MKTIDDLLSEAENVVERIASVIDDNNIDHIRIFVRKLKEIADDLYAFDEGLLRPMSEYGIIDARPQPYINPEVLRRAYELGLNEEERARLEFRHTVSPSDRFPDGYVFGAFWDCDGTPRDAEMMVGICEEQS